MKRSKELATAARHLFHIKRRGQRSKLARGHTTTSKHILSCSFPRRLSSEWSDRSSMVLRSRSRLRRSSRSLANGSSCSPHPSAAHKRYFIFLPCAARGSSGLFSFFIALLSSLHRIQHSPTHHTLHNDTLRPSASPASLRRRRPRQSNIIIYLQSSS